MKSEYIWVVTSESNSDFMIHGVFFDYAKIPDFIIKEKNKDTTKAVYTATQIKVQ